jgi:hypothetical protein
MKHILILFSFVTPGFAAEKSSLSLGQALEDTAQLCSQIENQYVYLRYKEAFYGFSWRDRCKDFESRLRQGSNEDRISLGEFSFFLSELMGVFKDAHTGLRVSLAPESQLQLGARLQYMPEGFWLRSGNPDIANQTQIAEADLPSEKLIVEAIQNVQIEKLVDMLPFVGSINSWAHRSSAASRLSGPYGGDLLKYLSTHSTTKLPWSDTIHMQLRSLKSGRVFTVNFPWKRTQFLAMETRDCSEREGFTFRPIQSDTYYLRLPTWLPKDENCFSEIQNFLVEKIDFLRRQEIPKLILDARNNGGGASIWQDFVRQLITREGGPKITNIVSYYKPGFPGYHLDQSGIPHQKIDGMFRPLWFSDKCKSLRYTGLSTLERNLISEFLLEHPRGFAEHFSSDSFSDPHVCILNPVEQSYRGRVAVLIDRYGYSSNDQFITSIKAAAPERVFLIGERTRGGSGGGGGGVLRKSGFRFAHAIFANWGRDSSLLEDRGTAPDFEVNETIEDVLIERDPFLEKALTVLDQ